MHADTHHILIIFVPPDPSSLSELDLRRTFFLRCFLLKRGKSKKQNLYSNLTILLLYTALSKISFEQLMSSFFSSTAVRSLRKQPTFRKVTTWALVKWRLSNERRNSILMMCTTQILVVLLIACAAREFSFN